jgi:hypothetical protein
MDTTNPAALTAPGICHNLPFGGHPRAGEPTLDNGTPTGHLVVGYLQTGQAVTVDSASEAYLRELETAVHLELARLSMWRPRQDIHPWGDAA